MIDTVAKRVSTILQYLNRKREYYVYIKGDY